MWIFILTDIEMNNIYLTLYIHYDDVLLSFGPLTKTYRIICSLQDLPNLSEITIFTLEYLWIISNYSTKRIMNE